MCMFKYPSLKYTEQVLTICEECWKVIDGKCCWMALVMLSCKTQYICRRCTENIVRFLRTCRTVCVLNTENTLHIEFQFELANSHICFLFLSAYSCFKHFTWMQLWWENYNYAWCCIWLWKLASYVDGRHRLKVFESWVLRKIFWSNTQKVTGRWKNLLNNDLHDLCSWSEVICVY